MKLSLCLITLLSIAPLCAMNPQLKERLKNMSPEEIQAKADLAKANMAIYMQEIEQEEDAFWSQSIDAMEQQVASFKASSQKSLEPNNN